MLKLPKDISSSISESDLEKQFVDIGRKYQNIQVDQIIFIHGTFVGEDPLFISETLKNFTNKRLHPIHYLFNRASKASWNFIGRDIGNFTIKHCHYINKFFKQKASLFDWSGSNTHLARLHAVTKLIDYLYKLKNDGNTSFMLFAHSHGGQVLALLSLILHKSEIRQKLQEHQLIDEDLILKSRDLINCKFAFITMGTPVRYLWNIDHNSDLIHLINHRGPLPIGSGIFGSFWTRGGDYIQQYAGAGSDYLPVLDMKYKVNKLLGEILEGKSLSVFKMLNRKQRLHKIGKNLLIDYRDSKFYPNFYSTIFGHGVYTRYYLLPFHLELILKQLDTTIIKKSI